MAREVDFLQELKRSYEAAKTTPLTATGASADGWVTQVAPNIIRWVMDPDFLNFGSVADVWRQYQILRDYFELRCPICNPGTTKDGDYGDCWGKTREQLAAEVLLEFNPRLQEDECPSCHITRGQLEEEGFFRGFNQMHLVIGQRAGKSVTAAIIATYIEHWLIVTGLATPGGLFQFFGTAKRDPFEVAFLASSAVQAEDTVWAKYIGLREEAPWFRRFTTWIQQAEKNQESADSTPWKYTVSKKKITIGHPAIKLNMVSLSANSGANRGRTRPAAFIDELAYFTGQDSRLSAREAYRAMERSLRTLRSRTKLYGGPSWIGSIFSVTSPLSRSDYTWELLRTAPKLKRMYFQHRPTWEFTPFESRESLADEFMKDPVGAERDYGANPPGSAFPFIINQPRFCQTVLADVPTLIQLGTRTFEDELKNTYVGAYVMSAAYDFSRRPHIITLDAGESFDSFAMTISREDIVEGTDGPYKVTVVVMTFRIVPELNKPVWFDSVVRLIEELKDKISIASVEFDRWQSTSMIQQIRNMGIRAEKRSLSKDDVAMFRANAMEGRVRMPRPHADDFDGTNFTKISHLDMHMESIALAELFELQEDPDTRVVSNPLKNKGRRGEHSDDVIRTVFHANRIIQASGISDVQTDNSKRTRRERVEQSGRDWSTRGGVVRPLMPRRTR
jgi:hypothetical protein